MLYRYFEILLFFYGLDYPYRFILVIFFALLSAPLILMFALVVRGLKGLKAFSNNPSANSLSANSCVIKSFSLMSSSYKSNLFSACSACGFISY
ncbi:hypothetical protein HMPREF1451_00863 [Helicobacter pylori HP260BFii]|uniref:Uncharacterized protein n=1 Tax=Helicobacter pylori GAM260BSi TaxID=1159046 RepID=M3P865_HELPX|nr:hypothetical protein HMPREF1418_01627 [Helicobacter pylori GAM260BSi]EMH68090.1 hypothetical protein HMPREF1451_00863 [Helicobacter pylori HP260BFii]